MRRSVCNARASNGVQSLCVQISRERSCQYIDTTRKALDCATTLPLTVFTRRRSFAEYWKYFVTRFNDVHAFGYNSAGSERIWMKFGEPRVYCLELALTDFGCDPRRSESERPCGSFFCLVNNSRLCRFPVSQISRNLHTKRGSVRW